MTRKKAEFTLTVWQSIYKYGNKLKGKGRLKDVSRE